MNKVVISTTCKKKNPTTGSISVGTIFQVPGSRSPHKVYMKTKKEGWQPVSVNLATGVARIFDPGTNVHIISVPVTIDPQCDLNF